MASSATTAILALRKTVLIIDPQEPVSNLFSRLALLEGWNLQQVPDNQTVLSLMEAEGLDLVISGQRTPARQDFELLEKIRCVDPHIRMIILKDRGTQEDVIASVCQHAFSYFRRPFEDETLARMARMAMMQSCWEDGIEVISATPEWTRLLARCTIETAERLVQFLRQADLPYAEKEDFAVAGYEILLNAIEHGGHFQSDEYVEIRYLQVKRMIACCVQDPGKGFALEELRHAAINNPAGDLFTHLSVREDKGLRPGGFGLLLAKHLVDEMVYGQHGNEVILVKYLDPTLRDSMDKSSDVFRSGPE
jgi:anti-sigma regulatory factor (Ser/Thr protein kinase)/DNA-binding NarL/FixJ family response regulator